MPYDNDITLRAGSTGITVPAALAATETGTGKDFGADKTHITYTANFPTLLVSGSASGSVTLQVKIQESDDNSTYNDLATFENITEANTPGCFFVTAMSSKRYRRDLITVTSGCLATSGSPEIMPGFAGRDTKY